jgi:hypothetical protein
MYICSSRRAHSRSCVLFARSLKCLSSQTSCCSCLPSSCSQPPLSLTRSRCKSATNSATTFHPISFLYIHTPPHRRITPRLPPQNQIAQEQASHSGVIGLLTCACESFHPMSLSPSPSVEQPLAGPRLVGQPLCSVRPSRTVAPIRAHVRLLPTSSPACSRLASRSHRRLAGCL